MQQINLYLPELRPHKTYFSARFTAFAALSLIALLFVMQWIIGRSLATLEQQVTQLENQKVATSQQLEKLKSRPVAATAAQLDQQIAQLSRELSERRQLEQILEGQNLGNKDGFAAYLESLARRSNNDLALDQIRLTRGGNFAELAGEARQGEQVPAFLDRLKTEPPFYNTRFGMLHLGRNQARGGTVQFRVGLNEGEGEQ